MKIAIVGSGISGLTCGYYLSQEHDVSLFEANDYLGGHTATIDITQQGRDYAIDTGFIVYNDRTYPNFIRLLDEIGIKGLATEMSFSVRHDGSGLEYNGHTLATLFAQKRNLLRPKFYYFLYEIMRFNRLAKRHASQHDTPNSQAETLQTLGDFLEFHGFSDYFCHHYILPMGAAIWSSSMADMRDFPLHFFTRFFLNHGLLDIANRPQWYVIPGGSKNYIPKLVAPFVDRIFLSTPVQKVSRHQHGVTLHLAQQTMDFDAVIFACHSDQALALLDTPTDAEQRILAAMPYRQNQVVLHTDTSVLPKRKAAWAAWNYRIGSEADAMQTLPTVSYNMNILQRLLPAHGQTFCVTLNPQVAIDADQVIGEFTYAHPVFNQSSLLAAHSRSEINGHHRTWFCGAYWYNGFHEDGVRSALDVIEGIAKVAAIRGAA
ncbi:hypothetical protein VST7929_02863 [Vibrio stylophorae]|uniref:Amine oxidase domain-containing protein n=1 Tax=Vibrio stylophorae TaxID=659351 RepID=A0ABM8ZY74_9VIBR|nr:FAD-dependent oxidoreductase [Vibrio stylophorae]CAH0535202.1 hypothetical protein VST7929_02863 [Vibrio stylophorae]